MSIIRSAIRSSLSLRSSDPAIIRSSLPFLQDWRKCLSTTTEQPPPTPLPPLPQNSPVGGSISSPGQEKYYGKLSGFSRHILKTDILSVLEECNVTPDDLKVSYTRGGTFVPIAVYVRFPSSSWYDGAMRAVTKQGKIYKVERATRSQWDPIFPYEGKVVALHGLPANVTVDDIDRFLSGCLYHPGSVEFFTVQGFARSKKVALVRFTSQTQAMNAYITKNRGFILSQRIRLQILL